MRRGPCGGVDRVVACCPLVVRAEHGSPPPHWRSCSGQPARRCPRLLRRICCLLEALRPGELSRAQMSPQAIPREPSVPSLS